MKEQKFRMNEELILHDKKHDWSVKVVEANLDEEGNWWYDVVPTEFRSIPRCVPEERLERI